MSDPQRLAMPKILVNGGLLEGQQRGQKKYGRLRSDAIDERFSRPQLYR